MINTPPAQPEPEPKGEPIPNPAAPMSPWRIAQIVAAPPGWHTMTGSPRTTKTIKHDVAVWALLQHIDGRQVIRGYVDEPGEGGTLIDAQAEAAQSNQEWFGYALEAPPQPGKDDEE